MFRQALLNYQTPVYGTSSGEIWTRKFAPFVNNNNINAILQNFRYVSHWAQRNAKIILTDLSIKLD
jgi:hypothetical protein